MLRQNDQPLGPTAEIAFDRSMMPYRSRWSPTGEAGEVYLLRGVIVSAFAHADFLAMELAIRASAVPEYGFKETPPSRTATRVKYLKRVADTEGPLSPFRPLLEALIRRLEEVAKVRHYFAHAKVQVLSGGWIVFEDYDVRGAEITNTRKRHSPEDLRRIAFRAARFSRACAKLHYRLGTLKLLPSVDDVSGPSSASD